MVMLVTPHIVKRKDIDKRKYERKKNTLRYKLRKRKSMRKWQLNNKDRVKIYGIIHRAIKSGILIRPEKCTECGAFAKLQAHHDDYKKPFKVKWLCIPCHERIHHG